MKSRKWMVLLGVMICVVSGSVYAWDSIHAASAKENGDFTATISMKEYDLLSEQDQANFDAVVVYNDGEYTSLISREQYDAVSERDKANFDHTYKKIIEIIEKNEKVVDDQTAQASYERTGNVAAIANNLSCVSMEVLDEIFIDYIAKTQDIGMLVVAKDYLSQEAIDQIVKNYVITTEDIGILETSKDSIQNTIED